MLFSNFWLNFNEDIIRLVFGFAAFVGSVASSGSLSDYFAASAFVAGSGVGVLPKYFIGNNLRLNLLNYV